MKKGLRIGLGIAVIGIVVAFLSFVNSKSTQSNCQDIRVKIDTAGGLAFVKEAQILQMVGELCSADTTRIQVHTLEHEIMLIPAVKSCEVYRDLNGIFTIQIKQRKPIARLCYASGDDQYIDTEGNLMPIIPGAPYRVMVFSGKIPDAYTLKTLHQEQDSLSDSVFVSPDILREMYAIASTIDSTPFWRANIEQIYRQENGEYILIPKVGEHEIWLGNAEHVSGKLEKLYLFYNQALTKSGWREYKRIDIRFKGQVIAKKELQTEIIVQDSIETENLH